MEGKGETMYLITYKTKQNKEVERVCLTLKELEALLKNLKHSVVSVRNLNLVPLSLEEEGVSIGKSA